MFRTFPVVCLLLLAPASPARAHPGVGIVRDGLGNVYYTDLSQVWRIAPDGSKSVAVPDVHTHDLAIDPDGNLYGEDQRYLGGDRYRHRVWRLTPDGLLRDEVPWRDGFWQQYGLVRDADGSRYWVEGPGDRCQIRKRAPDGRVTTVAPDARFGGPVQWMAAGPDGSLFVIDGEALRRISREGRLTTVAGDLGPHPMGLRPDPRGGVYVAVHGARSIVRVGPDGRVVTVARTPEPWGPSGVLRAPDGDLWILEYSDSNQARVRRVAADGRTTVY